MLRPKNEDPLLAELKILVTMLQQALSRGKVHGGTAVLIGCSKFYAKRLRLLRKEQLANQVPITRAQLNLMLKLHEVDFIAVATITGRRSEAVWMRMRHMGLVALDMNAEFYYLTEFGLNELGHRGLIPPPGQEVE